MLPGPEKGHARGPTAPTPQGVADLPVPQPNITSLDTCNVAPSPDPEAQPVPDAPCKGRQLDLPVLLEGPHDVTIQFRKHGGKSWQWRDPAKGNEDTHFNQEMIEIRCPSCIFFEMPEDLQRQNYYLMTTTSRRRISQPMPVNRAGTYSIGVWKRGGIKLHERIKHKFKIQATPIGVNEKSASVIELLSGRKWSWRRNPGVNPEMEPSQARRIDVDLPTESIVFRMPHSNYSLRDRRSKKKLDRIVTGKTIIEVLWQDQLVHEFELCLNR